MIAMRYGAERSGAGVVKIHTDAHLPPWLEEFSLTFCKRHRDGSISVARDRLSKGGGKREAGGLALGSWLSFTHVVRN
jgi:hypothetical protein